MVRSLLFGDRADQLAAASEQSIFFCLDLIESVIYRFDLHADTFRQVGFSHFSRFQSLATIFSSVIGTEFTSRFEPAQGPLGPTDQAEAPIYRFHGA